MSCIPGLAFNLTLLLLGAKYLLFLDLIFLYRIFIFNEKERIKEYKKKIKKIAPHESSTEQEDESSPRGAGPPAELPGAARRYFSASERGLYVLDRLYPSSMAGPT